MARYGAKVKLANDARQRSLNAYYLLLEGAREGIPIYFFNRGTGSGRQVPIFTGDPLSTDVARRRSARSRRPVLQPGLPAPAAAAALPGGHAKRLRPEVADEEIVRAMMVVRANNMVYEAASPQLTQTLIDLINRRITPGGAVARLARARATSRRWATSGRRWSASATRTTRASACPARSAQEGRHEAAPGAAGQPFAPGRAVRSRRRRPGQHQRVHRRAGRAAGCTTRGACVDWAELLYAMELQGMNSSVTPIASIVQAIPAVPVAELQSAAQRAAR